ncbi:MAG: mevalonate kinase family protein [Promethearchaeota archaeon]
MEQTEGKSSNGTEMIRVDTPARAGILGNPSDGFHGKTLAVPVRNFRARVLLFEWEGIEILPGPADHVNFRNLRELVDDIDTNGYYGGYRLIKAAIKQFHELALELGHELPDRGFTIRYTTDIPRQVGLAGSSAIITSTVKALCAFHGVEVDPAVLANRVLWAETRELGISAGLQDRVVQAYDGPVFMDFDAGFMEEHGHGRYQPVDPALFPPMYLAYRVSLTHEATAHNDVRARWERGDPEVVEVMGALARNAEEGYEALRRGDRDAFERAVDHNFDLRASLYPISGANLRMVELARSVGATAKFPGSGGAIVGTYSGEAQFGELARKLGEVGCRVVKLQLQA